MKRIENGRLAFGKHRGRTLDEVAEIDECSYLTWMGANEIGTPEEQEQVWEAIEAWKRRHNCLTLAEEEAEEATWD